MIVEEASSRIEMYRKMICLRDREDTVEPIGYIEDLGDGAFRFAYEFDDIESSNMTRDIIDSKLRGFPDVWHGHPNGNFEFTRKNSILEKLEDGNPNKPSIPDLLYLICNDIRSSTIAVPEGIIILQKGSNQLLSFLDKWLNLTGVRTPRSFELIASSVFSTLLQHGGVDRYSCSTWQEGAQCLGITSSFYQAEEILACTLVGRTVIATPDIIAHQNNYLQRGSFKRDSRATMERLVAGHL